MKINHYILIFAIFICNINLRSQTCESCREKQYPFTGCCTVPPGYERCTRCTNDPLNQTDDFKVFKKCNLSINLIDYDESGFPFEGGLRWVDNDGHIPDEQESIIDLIQTRTDINDALSQWLSVCTPTNYTDCDGCRLKVKWARDREEMHEFPNSLAIAYQPLAAVAGGEPCSADCNRLEIVINATNQFMHCDPEVGEFPDFTERRFFYTNKFTYNKSNMHWFHYKSIILHEIGHWLGLGDVKSGTCIPSGANYNSTVMWSEIYDMQERDVLSEIDKCMFMLLYCCDPTTDINDNYDIKVLNFKVIPNPATKELIIKYNLVIPSYVNLYLFNSIGQTEAVIHNKEIQESGKHEIVISTIKLLSGMYSLVLEINNKRINEKVIIKK